MKSVWKQIRFMAMALLMAVAVAGCTGDGAVRTRVKILHINDVHSHLDTENIDLTFDGLKTGCEIGGMARVAALIAELADPESQQLVLHAGDAVQGTLYYTLFEGRADADVMNGIGFDAMAIGNHEFDDGDGWLAGFIQMVDAPVISANITVAPGNILGGLYTPYVVREINNEKIGIIGLTIAQKTRDSSRPGDGVIFNDEVASVKAAVDELTAAGIGKIILLSHYGYDNVKALAARVTDVDVIVDGDSHTLLGDFTDYGLDSSGDYPTVVKNADNDNVCVVQAWEYGKALGELDVTFLDDVLETCEGTPHLILGQTFTRENSQGERYTLSGDALAAVQEIIHSDRQLDIVTDDPPTAAIVSNYAREVNALGGVEIGQANEDLMHGRVPGHAYHGGTLSLGSDIAPIVARAFFDQDANADVCIQNAGAVRISIPRGGITYSMAYEMLPFSNTLFEVTMTGAEIKQVLEDAIDNIVNNGSTGSFPYSYALKFDVDANQVYGDRVTNLEVKDRETGVYSLLETEAFYVVVTNNYIAEGLDGYDTFKRVQENRGAGTDTYLDYALAFVNYVKASSASGASLEKLPVEDHCIKSYIPTPDETDNL